MQRLSSKIGTFRAIWSRHIHQRTRSERKIDIIARRLCEQERAFRQSGTILESVFLHCKGCQSKLGSRRLCKILLASPDISLNSGFSSLAAPASRLLALRTSPDTKAGRDALGSHASADCTPAQPGQAALIRGPPVRQRRDGLTAGWLPMGIVREEPVMPDTRRHRPS